MSVGVTAFNNHNSACSCHHRQNHRPAAALRHHLRSSLFFSSAVAPPTIRVPPLKSEWGGAVGVIDRTEDFSFLKALFLVVSFVEEILFSI
jgi:hypothetical protein